MIGRSIPSIISRVRGGAGNMMSPMGDGGMQSTLDDAVNTMKGIGEPTSLETDDSGGEYTTHPAKM
jgi:hypothetical protein